MKREMWKFTPLAACSPPCFSTRQGNRMNAMRLPVKGEEGREKGAPCLFFRLVPGKNAVCIRSIIVGRRFYPSLFSLLPSRNRFMRLPCEKEESQNLLQRYGLAPYCQKIFS